MNYALLGCKKSLIQGHFISLLFVIQVWYSRFTLYGIKKYLI